jgi:hypothetical protein
MADLIIAAAGETPQVNLSSENGTFSFSGKSYPENVHEFYAAVFQYINEYVQSPAPTTELSFRWLYFNTATSKVVVKIILDLKKVLDKGKQFKIKWYCRSNDELMLEKGEELRDILGLDFEVIRED